MRLKFLVVKVVTGMHDGPREFMGQFEEGQHPLGVPISRDYPGLCRVTPTSGFEKMTIEEVKNNWGFGKPPHQLFEVEIIAGSTAIAQALPATTTRWFVVANEYKGRGSNPNSHNVKPAPLKGRERRSLTISPRITPTAKRGLQRVEGKSVADIIEAVGQALASNNTIVVKSEDGEEVALIC